VFSDISPPLFFIERFAWYQCTSDYWQLS